MSRRRLLPRQILGLVLLTFVLGIVVEIAVAVLVARVIGPWPTLLLIVAFSFAGLLVVRRGGARSVRALRQAAQARRLPGGEMTDAVLLFVLPVTRPLVRWLCGRFLRFQVVGRMAQAWPGGPTVVQGEIVTHDDIGQPGVQPDARDPQTRDDEIGPGPG
jgi:UPF0716 family protein affecting phage T7 exclusion